MPSQIRIVLGPGEVTATLDDSPTADAIRAALPLQSVVNRWGEEIYFSIPVKAAEAPNARQEMAVGELAYWPVGSALCIFFGPTPASTGDAPRAYSAVNPVGQVQGDPEASGAVLTRAVDGQPISVFPV